MRIAFAVRGLGVVASLAACRSTPHLLPERAAEAELAARRAIANERALDSAALAPQSVGVLPLYVSASDTAVAPLAFGLADLLMTDLARSRQLHVVERLRMDALLRELRLAESGRVDTTSAPRVGRLVGAGRLVVGGLAQRPDSQLHVDARVANVSTTELQRSVSADASLDAILDAEKALALHLFDELHVNLTPAERAAVEERPTRNIAALLAYSRAVRDEAYGRYDEARGEYARAVQLDPRFALARRRLADLGGAAAGQAAGERVGRAGASGAAGASEVLRRAGLAAGEGVNRPLVAQIGSPADPAFTGSRMVTLIITISTAP